jgi:hypothetical protein
MIIFGHLGPHEEAAGGFPFCREKSVDKRSMTEKKLSRAPAMKKINPGPGSWNLPNPK